MKRFQSGFVSVCLIFLMHACKEVVHFSENTPLHVSPDLEIHLWAESPMVFNPTNMDIDARGRVWVTEAVNYRNYNNDSTKVLHFTKGDRVMILEDQDDDGHADASKIFVQDTDLVAPMGIAVIGNKVFVSCSPHLLVYTDDNGDDIPDHKEIFLTGFGGHDHDHALHAVVGGPDGVLYFNTGNAGPHTVKDKSGWTLRSGSIYTGGSPYNTSNHGNRISDDGRIWVGGLGLKINPDGTGLKVIGHNFRNSYELTIDSKGNVWQNDNDDQVVTCRTSWLMEGGNAGYFSADGTRYWQADQRPGQDIFTAHWHQEDPGVMPAGDRTGAGSPTGIVLNESDALGVQYSGMLLSADAGRNVIFAYHPSPYLSGFDLGERKNFITSLDTDNEGYVWNDSLSNTDHYKWFRPSDVAIGTEGAVYIADWYDPVVGGHLMEDTAGYGRIYQLGPKNKKLKRPRYDLSTKDGLLQAFLSPAINVRFEAGARLKSMGASIIPDINRIAGSHNPYLRARAIWLLSGLGQEGIKIVEDLIKDTSGEVRITAYKALRRQGVDILPYASTLINDTSSYLRREVVASLADLSYTSKGPILMNALHMFNPLDRWYLEALGQAIRGDEEKWMADIITSYNLIHQDPIRWSDTIEAIVWRLHPLSEINNLALRSTSSVLTPEQRKRSITALAFINDKLAVQAMIGLANSDLPDVKEQATYWLAFRQSNDWFDLYDWRKWNRNPAAERKLAEMKVCMTKILDAKLPYNEKKWNAQAMAKDSIGANMLLTMISNHQFPAALNKEISSILLNHADLSIRILASQSFSSDSITSIFPIPSIMKLPADDQRGQSLFSSKCSLCHRMENKGNTIGPDLGTIHLKYDQAALLDAIVNPSAAIVFGYETWTIRTQDGQTHLGFLVSENKQSVTLKELSGAKSVLPTQQIISRNRQTKSLMPSAALLKLSDQDLADLSEYLLKKK